MRQDSGTFRLIFGNGDWREDLEMRYSDYNVMHYNNEKLLADMGCAQQVYERIKDTNPDYTYVVCFAQEIKKSLEKML